MKTQKQQFLSGRAGWSSIGLAFLFVLSVFTSYSFAHNNTQNFGDGDNCGPNTVGHEHSDDFFMDGGADCASTLGGPDRIFGGSGADDELQGGGGEDIVNGGDHDDQVIGGPENDDVGGGDSGDIVIGGENADRLSGEPGDDNVRGWDGTFSDNLGGGAGNSDKCFVDVGNQAGEFDENHPNCDVVVGN